MSFVNIENGILESIEKSAITAKGKRLAEQLTIWAKVGDPRLAEALASFEANPVRLQSGTVHSRDVAAKAIATTAAAHDVTMPECQNGIDRVHSRLVEAGFDVDREKIEKSTQRKLAAIHRTNVRETMYIRPPLSNGGVQLSTTGALAFCRGRLFLLENQTKPAETE